jgi:hypothetical protein
VERELCEVGRGFVDEDGDEGSGSELLDEAVVGFTWFGDTFGDAQVLFGSVLRSAVACGLRCLGPAASQHVIEYG